MQQLIFIKTTEGEIFGGYTKEGYRSRNESIKDSNAFVFSLSKKKFIFLKTAKMQSMTIKIMDLILVII